MKLVTFTLYSEVDSRHYPFSVNPDSIESVRAVEPGRWHTYSTEIRLKTGKTILVIETHTEVLKRLNESDVKDNDTGGAAHAGAA